MTDSEKLDLLLKALQYMPLSHKSNCAMMTRDTIVVHAPCTCGYLQLMKDLGLK